MWRQPRRAGAREVEAFVAQTIGVRVVSGAGVDVDAATLAGYPAQSLAILWPAIAARAGVTLDRRGTLRLADFTLAAQGGCARASVRRVGSDSLA